MIEFFNTHSQLTHESEMARIDGRYFLLSGILDENTAHRIMLILLGNPKSSEKVKVMRQDGITDQVDIVKQFKACNWDALEELPDIADDDHMNFEYVNCGNKGLNRRCPYSRPGDPKPYCIVKTLYNIPQHAEISSNRRRIA